MRIPSTLAAVALISSSSAAIAQQGPAPRPLGAVIATSSESFGGAVFVRHLKTGVLVNDVMGRRLLWLDSTLSHPVVIADTTAATANAYSGRSAGLIAYRGDSSLFVDAQSMSMLVVDPAGKIARTMAIPRSQDAMVLGSNTFGSPALDASGRLVYRGFPFPRFGPRTEQRSANGTPVFTPPDIPDSTAVVRVDLATRVVDTAGFTKIPKVKLDIQRDDNGRVQVTTQMNPLPVVDDW